MIVHNIDPAIFSIGPITIHWYGLVYVLAFLLAYYILKKAAISGKVKNLTPQNAENLVLYLIIGMLIGARFFEVVIYNLPYYFHHPQYILMIWRGGLSFHGGFLGLVAGALIFARKHHIRFYDLADLLVIPGALGLAFGRIANFINGELVGIITNVPWCVKFLNYDGCRHPVVLYESLKNFFIFGVLAYLYTKKKEKLPAGFIFWLFILMYGVLRFFITFVREDPRFLGIGLGQFMSLIMAMVALIVLLHMHKTKSKNI